MPVAATHTSLLMGSLPPPNPRQKVLSLASKAQRSRPDLPLGETPSLVGPAHSKPGNCLAFFWTLSKKRAALLVISSVDTPAKSAKSIS